MGGPAFDLDEIDRRKLTDYLLAVEHPEGGAKVRFFLACGFSIKITDAFATALRAQAANGVAHSSNTPFGV